MEKMPQPEGKKETIEINQLIEMIRTRGLDDPEVYEYMMQWTLEQEEIVARTDTAEACIRFDMSRAGLYLATDDFDGAWQTLEEARLKAFHQNETELYEEIMRRMDDLEKDR